MKMMGLTDTPYWLSWFVWYTSNYGTSANLDVVLSAWIETVRTRESPFGGKYYERLQGLQTSMVIFGIVTNLLARVTDPYASI